jgi:hypothetical protein
MRSTHKQIEERPRECVSEETHVSGTEGRRLSSFLCVENPEGASDSQPTRGSEGVTPGGASLTGARGMGKGGIAFETRGLPTDPRTGS